MSEVRGRLRVPRSSHCAPCRMLSMSELASSECKGCHENTLQHAFIKRLWHCELLLGAVSPVMFPQ